MNEKGAVSTIGTTKKGLYNKKLLYNNEHNGILTTGIIQDKRDEDQESKCLELIIKNIYEMYILKE